LRLLPRHMTIDQADRYTRILIEIQNGVDPADQLDDLVAVLSEAGVTGIRNHLRTLLRLSDAEPEKIQQWVNEVVRSREYWAEGLDQTYANFQSEPEMQLLRIGTSAAVVTAVGTFMQALIVVAQH